jgi:hypothetical protein
MLQKLVAAIQDTSPSTNDADAVLSYNGLRKCFGVIGLLLPCVLYVGHFFVDDARMPGSISAFYYTPLRNYFIGTLCALGVFLFSYRYAPRDNVLGTVAGVLVIFVALNPTAAGAERSGWNDAHLYAASLFFAILAYFCYVLFPQKPSIPPSWLPPWPTATQEDKRDLTYRMCGLAIALALAVAVVGMWADWDILFWCESAAVVAFSTAWSIKGGLLGILAD